METGRKPRKPAKGFRKSECSNVEAVVRPSAIRGDADITDTFQRCELIAEAVEEVGPIVEFPVRL
jgi:hypothetical protein